MHGLVILTLQETSADKHKDTSELSCYTAFLGGEGAFRFHRTGISFGFLLCETKASYD
jgi:hypothetical protein